MKNHVMYFTNPNQISIIEESIPCPQKDELLIQNIISGISAGTEMLIYRGQLPNYFPLDDSIPSLNKKATYPFKYGYCSVGKVIEAGEKKLNHFIDKWVFVFNPHESFFCAKPEEVILLPDNISPYDALFIANMETAINLVLDGSPLIGENVMVLGLGIVGLLTTALLQQFPLSLLLGVDLYHMRRKLTKELGAHHVLDGTQPNLDAQLQQYLNKRPHKEIDLIYELTGNPNALNTAINFASYESRIVLGSWYGNKSCQIDLGGKFHRSRIKIIASQVSTLASELKGRWNKKRRFDVAFDMLEKIKPARFISHKFHITDANKAYQLVHSNPGETLLVTLTYEV